MEKFITLYKASAGAGKTHTLTQDYIKLILEDYEAYKHVLAVTFTNKATDEMKQRILKELHKMASDPSCPQKERARSVLVKILHDYPAFSVSTIDKFFQSVMRAFARELGRMMTYSVELDAQLVLSNAVDNMFSDLDKSENGKLLEWLIEFSLDQIESGESWKIQDNILKLSKELFTEKFKVKSTGAALGADEAITVVSGLKESINSVVGSFEESCGQIGTAALAVMEECGLECTDFWNGKKSPFNIFSALAEGEKFDLPLNSKFYDFHDNVNLWYPKSKAKQAYLYEQAYDAGLNDIIGEFIQLHEKEFIKYRTALLVKKNINSLAILGRVYSYILDYCKEKNVVLLSETTELLSRIIDGSDTPFIYERVGTWIDNFMLDEFQDTSIMQWNNFVPLLANSIANGDKNLIVGDIKQSIYRFRNSDWTILQKGVDANFPNQVDSHPLKENWRSAKNIISFNNTFFEAAAAGAAELFANGAASESINQWARQIPMIYSNFAQNASPKSLDGGQVRVTFISKSAIKEIAAGQVAGEEDYLSYHSVVGEHLLRNVRRLLDGGYRQKDIGILVRNNKEGAHVARVLMEADPSYRVVSADSLMISSSAAVMRIMIILQWLDDPESMPLNVIAVLGDNFDGMPDQTQMEYLKGMPLYQMGEEIVRCFLNREQQSDVTFIQAFLDLVLEYSVREGSTLSGFIRWWNESGCNKSISSPEGQDAFQVMTIHKSKGLDFEVVILPYFKCTLDHNQSNAPLLWSSNASGEFGYGGPLPVKYSKRLENTLFESDYCQEKLEVYVDNLNIAYVAFTRPRRELVVIAEMPEENKDGSLRGDSVSRLLYEFVTGGWKTAELPSEESGLKRVEIESVTGEVEMGDVTLEYEEYVSGAGLGASEEQPNGFAGYIMGSQFTNPLNQKRLRTSLQSGSINEGLTLRDNGILMHDLFAGISSKADIGNIADLQMRQRVMEMVESVEDRGWFSDEYKVMKECSIIRPDGTLLRPDRVMVKGNTAIVTDYKFGDFVPDNKKYHKQVQRYMQLLMEMGYTGVEGYLWYPIAGKVETVLL